MESILLRGYEAIESKLGGLASFIPAIAQSIKKSIDEEDYAAVDAKLRELDKRTHEGREALAAADNLAAYVRQALRDGDLTLAEGAEMALLVERLVDEAEDVVTGVDEDDPVEPEGPAS